MFGLGWTELLLILLIVIIIFGASRLRDLGSGLGQGIREFKKSISREDPKEEEEGKKEKGP
jgi:sec-independent protein translocase protein TatA